MLLGVETSNGLRPLVGRSAELRKIERLLDRVGSDGGGALLLVGDSGVGKSRLLRAGQQEAERRGWWVASGRAYPVETGIPYSPFADAFLPVLRELSPAELITISRGGDAELAELFPGLRSDAPEAAVPGEPPAERRTRLLWNFVEFLSRLSGKHPLLLVLDDLQWADASSLELLHFIVRRTGELRVVVLCAFNDGVAAQDARLSGIGQALKSLPTVDVLRITPLSEAETAELVQQRFGVGESVVRSFVSRLHAWTRGNPFFIRETLDTLVIAGRLRQDQGLWTGWDIDTLDLPTTIRDSVLGRLGDLTVLAREVADLFAVVGTSVSHDLLCRISGSPEDDVVRAVDELRGRGLIDERLHLGEVVYDFAHPLVRETLYGELGLARCRLLHTRVARAMEVVFGEVAIERSGELAYHYARASGGDVGPKAVRYLAAAGRAALDRYANREAADFLSAAVDLVKAGTDSDGESTIRLLDDFARARQRLGEFDDAVGLWYRALDLAEADDDHACIGRVHRRLGLVDYRRGRYGEALEHFARGLAAARTAADELLEARLHLARGGCLMELGNPTDAQAAINTALLLAERGADRGLLTRVHFALLLLHTWIGPPDSARQHGEQALRLASAANNDGLRCTVEWGLVVLSGLTGDGPATARHMAACEELADELGSPLHRLRLTEPMVEFLASTGDWELALERGEQGIATASALNQRSVLSRLLVWTALIYFGRGDTVRGKDYVDRAWSLARLDADDQPIDVHTAVPAHVGRAAQLIADGDYAAAVEIAEAGLRIADRTGYTVWAIHRLLPILAEAHLSMGDIEGAARVGRRLRADSLRLGHRLGLAWADACDALVAWLQGDIPRGILELRQAAENLESIPAVPDAARLRRHFAARLRDAGERDEALRELRHIHEVFLRLGAEPELAKTRDQIRELGARPPVRAPARGSEGLSSREREVARLAAEGKSNKTIARALSISPRTVSTHLTSIFGKLGVSSRAELAASVGSAVGFQR